MNEIERLKQENQRLRAGLRALVDDDNWRSIDCGEGSVSVWELWASADSDPELLVTLALDPEAEIAVNLDPNYKGNPANWHWLTSDWHPRPYLLHIGGVYVGQFGSEQIARDAAQKIIAETEQLIMTAQQR